MILSRLFLRKTKPRTTVPPDCLALELVGNQLTLRAADGTVTEVGVVEGGIVESSGTEILEAPVPTLPGFVFKVAGQRHFPVGFVPWYNTVYVGGMFLRADYTDEQLWAYDGFWEVSHDGAAWNINQWSNFAPVPYAQSDPCAIEDAPSPDLAVWSGIIGPAGEFEWVADARPGDTGYLTERRVDENGVIWEYNGNWSPSQGYLNNQVEIMNVEAVVPVTLPPFVDTLLMLRPDDNAATSIDSLTINLPNAKDVRVGQTFAIISEIAVTSLQLISQDSSTYYTIGGSVTELAAMETVVLKIVEGIDKAPTLIRLA